jgi:hypothetical protein
MRPYHPAWENAAKDGGMRCAFPPYGLAVCPMCRQLFGPACSRASGPLPARFPHNRPPGLLSSWHGFASIPATQDSTGAVASLIGLRSFWGAGLHHSGWRGWSIFTGWFQQHTHCPHLFSKLVVTDCPRKAAEAERRNSRNFARLSRGAVNLQAIVSHEPIDQGRYDPASDKEGDDEVTKRAEVIV